MGSVSQGLPEPYLSLLVCVLQPKRKGRGIGSGLGKTAGRGHKGQKARRGVTPLILSAPLGPDAHPDWIWGRSLQLLFHKEVPVCYLQSLSTAHKHSHKLYDMIAAACCGFKRLSYGSVTTNLLSTLMQRRLCP